MISSSYFNLRLWWLILISATTIQKTIHLLFEHQTERGKITLQSKDIPKGMQKQVHGTFRMNLI
jgi:hypothetical protein